MYDPYLAIPTATVVNLLGLVYLLSGPAEQSISSVASCELELRELLAARANLESLRRLCWLFLLFIVLLACACAGLCCLLWDLYKPVTRSKGAGKGILQ